MMKRLFIFQLILAFSFIAVHAQTNPKRVTKECSALIARQAVEQQALESKSVAETDKRINILLRLADFLWISDEENARKYFTESFQIAETRFHENGSESKTMKSIVVYQPDYRFKVIEAISRRDAEWAKKLSEKVLKEFDDDKEKDRRSEFDKDREIRELLGLAAIADANQTLADQIYGELLVNYSNAEVFRLLYLSAYPFGAERIWGVEKYSLGGGKPDNFSPNPNLKRQFLLAFFRRIMKLTPENTAKSLHTFTAETAIAVMALNEIEPIIAQQFPDLMQTFEQARNHAESVTAATDIEAAKKRDESGKSFFKSFDERLAQVEKAKSAGKLTDFDIFQLVQSAKTEDNYKLAEKWLDKISDERGREAVSDYFYFLRSKLATTENRFDDAEKFAVKISQIEHRGVLFFDIVEAKMKEPMTKAESLDVLLEVYQMAAKAPDTVEKAQVLLGVAFMYEKIDHYNALNALSEAIKTANKLGNPDLTANYISRQIQLKNFSFYARYLIPGFEVSETFYALSKKDFQNALTYSINFSDKYLRTLAALASVKDCENNENPAKPKTKAK